MRSTGTPLRPPAMITPRWRSIARADAGIGRPARHPLASALRPRLGADAGSRRDAAGSSPGVPVSGSRNGRLRCTGPWRAALQARNASDRHVGAPAASGTPGSWNQRTDRRVQVRLVDRLRGADVAQLRWPVGRDHQHRDVGEPGLDDGGMEVGRRRAARAQQHRRHAVEADPEGDERGHPLVVHDVHRHVMVRRQGDRHRRASRARRDHGVPHAEPHPLVDQGGAERRGDGHRG